MKIKKLITIMVLCISLNIYGAENDSTMRFSRVENALLKVRDVAISVWQGFGDIERVVVYKRVYCYSRYRYIMVESHSYWRKKEK